MMNLFAKGTTLKVYMGWQVVETRPFSSEEITMIDSCKAVESQYGISVEFHIKGTGFVYIPCAPDSNIAAGDTVDITKLEVTELHKEGEDNIFRVDYKK